ncbi:hypothetical protein PspLS_12073 [Pyricularia sp. CBS 133598]|nr:hypothetical protein PspLS_12073 [Pyricularia sp. CBS 133598]
MSRMRILALHGVGSSANILRTQLSTFIRAADDYYEIVCIDGFFDSPRGPCIDKKDAGPFYSFMQGYSPCCIQEAHKRLRDVISEQGPFDGILGFSQGGSIALSYLYQQQCYGFDPELKFAVLLSSVVPFSADPRTHEKAVKHICCDQDYHPESQPQDQSAVGVVAAILEDVLSRTFATSCSMGATAAGYDNQLFFRPGADPSDVPRVLHPRLLAPGEDPLALPTVHAHGRRDLAGMKEMAEAAWGMCDPGLSKQLVHSGAHCPPQRPSEVATLVQALHWAVRQHFETAHL